MYRYREEGDRERLTQRWVREETGGWRLVDENFAQFNCTLVKKYCWLIIVFQSVILHSFFSGGLQDFRVSRLLWNLFSVDINIRTLWGTHHFVKFKRPLGFCLLPFPPPCHFLIAHPSLQSFLAQ